MNVIRGSVTTPKGFKAAGIRCGIKDDPDLRDLSLILSENPGNAAAVYTQNKVKAPPIFLNQKHLEDGRAQAIIANSGNANTCTGDRGFENAERTAKLTAEVLGIRSEDVLATSTGVIGVPLPMDKIEAGIKRIAQELSVDGGDAAALGIMTTDTFPKKIAVEIQLSDGLVSVGGIAKGSGMIAPNMATMHCFITTDASIESDLLGELLRKSVDRSFNCITVDGDMSTSDIVIVLANGMSGTSSLVLESDDTAKFVEALDFATLELAKMIAKDGEGATKFVTVKVEGARTFEDAKKAAKSVAESNLVKTAVFGRDPNWGRILCALGYSGVDVDERTITVKIGGISVYQNGLGVDFDHAKAVEVLSEENVCIDIDLGQGSEKIEFYTCDLTYDYVKINAEYTT